ncbi:MAG: peptide ABC transporter substrate-binding protein [Verrucomicrobia bacterium]|nr:peptide ABC transporter substrate-binding protein [Verrucomicrobiota bacterium]
MTRDIPERDWKVFKELRTVALERLCDKILHEAKAQIEHPAKSSHEKYLNLFKLIEKRDDDIARGFNDFRRSTVVMQIGIIHKMGLFTGEELRRFSPETQHKVEMYASIP